MKGLDAVKEGLPAEKTDDLREVLEYLDAMESIKTSSDENAIAAVIEQHHLSREHVPTDKLGFVNVSSTSTTWLCVPEAHPH